jgi:hypothetical protein
MNICQLEQQVTLDLMRRIASGPGTLGERVACYLGPAAVWAARNATLMPARAGNSPEEASKAAGARSAEEIALRRTGAERHAAPGVPAATDGERVRLEQVRVADAVVARVAYVMCVEPDLLGHESK